MKRNRAQRSMPNPCRPQLPGWIWLREIRQSAREPRRTPRRETRQLSGRPLAGFLNEELDPYTARDVRAVYRRTGY
ncbi:MAG: hypothetical protein GX882_06715 [Methanomicrobiales archaeon]|nr:hypothetical protein [Methanomicrobiales archaeon]